MKKNKATSVFRKPFMLGMMGTAFIPESSLLFATAAVILGALLIFMWVQTFRTRSLS